MIEIFYEDTEILDLDPEFFVLWLSKVTSGHNKQLGDVTLIFCSDNYLLEMNNQYLEHDYFTDIITFNYNEEDTISGDLFISTERIKDNARTFNESFESELNRVVVHGVLHLIGFNDKSEEEEIQMRKLEADALKLIVPRGT